MTCGLFGLGTLVEIEVVELEVVELEVGMA